MKQIILISSMLFAILSGAKSQNQFSDYVQFLKSEQKVIQLPDPKKINRFEYHIFPKPLNVKKTHNKVIVTFDRKQWEAFQYMHRKMWMRRDEVRKQLNELKK